MSCLPVQEMESASFEKRGYKDLDVLNFHGHLAEMVSMPGNSAYCIGYLFSEPKT